MAEGVITHSLKALELEREELRKDLVTFKRAYDVIHRRLTESGEEYPERAEAMNSWSGTWACIGSLELSTNMLEKKILEVSELIVRVRSGELANRDDPNSLCPSCGCPEMDPDPTRYKEAFRWVKRIKGQSTPNEV